MNLEHKHYRLDIKALNEDGTFEGIASVYGVTDMGGDIVEKGAFTKTLREKKGGRIPILWQHDTSSPIGSGVATDSPEGLMVKGALDLDIQKGREAYSLLKKQIVSGLSIGFQAVKDAITDGVRHLKEIKLWEISIVTFPMLREAQVTAVKAAVPVEEKRTFDESLELIELYAARYQMVNALCDSLDSIVWSRDIDNGEKVAQIDKSIEQFHLAYLDFIPKYLDALAAEGFSDKTTLEAKALEPWSNEVHDRITKAIDNLKALLKSGEAATSTPSPEAAPVVPGKPDYHLIGEQLAADIRRQLM